MRFTINIFLVYIGLYEWEVTETGQCKKKRSLQIQHIFQNVPGVIGSSLKTPHVFSSSRWTTREAALVKPTSSNIFRQWICYFCCIAGQKMETRWALLSLFFHFMLKIVSHTSNLLLNMTSWSSCNPSPPASRRWLGCSFSSPSW